MKELIQQLKKGKKSSRKNYERVNWKSDTHRLIVVQNIPNKTEAYRLIALDLSEIKYVAQQDPDLATVMADWGLDVSAFRKLEKKDDENVQAWTTFIGEGIDVYFDNETNEYSCGCTLYHPGTDSEMEFESGPGNCKSVALSRFYTQFNKQFQGCRLELDDLEEE